MSWNDMAWPVVHHCQVLHDTEFPTHPLLTVTLRPRRERTRVDKLRNVGHLSDMWKQFADKQGGGMDAADTKAKARLPYVPPAKPPAP